MECTICRLSRDLHAIILFYLRETPQTDNPTEMTQLMTRFVHVLCISGIVLGMTGLRLCVRSQRKHTYVLADTRVITYVIPSVMLSRHGGLSRVLPPSLSHVATEIYRSLSLCYVTWIDQSRTSIHPENLKPYNQVVECVILCSCLRKHPHVSFASLALICDPLVANCWDIFCSVALCILWADYYSFVV